MKALHQSTVWILEIYTLTFTYEWTDPNENELNDCNLSSSRLNS